MKRSSICTNEVGVLAVVIIAACSAATNESEPRTQPGAVVDQSAASASSVECEQGGYTAADVQFMQHMIAHHAQALVMTDMVPTHTRDEDLRLMAERIDVSQQDEIATMQNWLEDHCEEVPAVEVDHEGQEMAGTYAQMPGMLSAEELDRLAAATGDEFDRLFLEFMIRHHQGALTMVDHLLSTPGAAQEPEIFQFAAEVDADQRIEIARMRAMLESMTSE